MDSTAGVVSFEDIKELFRESDRQWQETKEQFKETDRKIQETDRQLKEMTESRKETDRLLKEASDRMDAKIARIGKYVGDLGNSIGDLVESMVGGSLIPQLNKLGYAFTEDNYMPKYKFRNNRLKISGEIDFLLDDDSTHMLVEVKLSLEPKDVNEHIERMRKYRLYLDAQGDSAIRIVGAVAGGSISEKVMHYAFDEGLYVIVVHSEDTARLVDLPEGFTPVYF